jgi:chromate transporter
VLAVPQNHLAQLGGYLFVIVPAPYFRRFSGNVRVNAFVEGVTAAATGAIAGAAFVLGRRALIDIPTVAIAGATWGALLLSKKISEPLVILVAGAVGMALRR